MSKQKNIFLIGGSGFLGRALVQALSARGHAVEVVARAGSEGRVPSGAVVYIGNPLDRKSYVRHLKPHHTVVQLVGVAHPNPLKKNQFQKIDFTAGRESVLAAREAGVKNFVYVSVAQPAPIMKSYVKARAGVETLLKESGMNASVLRPWYVIGPDRRWPLILMPLYWIFENQSATRATALRLGFVSLEQMVQTMVAAIEKPKPGFRIFEVPDIKKGGLA